jgi:hypothetical protein
MSKRPAVVRHCDDAEVGREKAHQISVPKSPIDRNVMRARTIQPAPERPMTSRRDRLGRARRIAAP